MNNVRVLLITLTRKHEKGPVEKPAPFHVCTKLFRIGMTNSSHLIPAQYIKPPNTTPRLSNLKCAITS